MLFPGDSEALAWASATKGAAFVLLSAAIIYFVMRSTTEDELSERPSDGREADAGTDLQPALLAVVLGACFIIALGLHAFTQYAERALSNATQSLRQNVETGAALVSRELERLSAENSIAASPFFGANAAQWQADGDPGQRAALLERLASIHSPNERLGASLLTPDGTVLLSSGTAGNLADTALARRVAASGTIALGQPRQGPGGRTVIEVHAPLRDARHSQTAEPVAVLVVWVAVSQLAEPILDVLPIATRRPQLMILDEIGGRYRLLAPVGGAGLQPMQLLPAEFQPVDAASLSSQSVARTFASEGEVLAVVSPITGSDWSIAAVRPTETVLTPLRRLALAGLGVVVAATILVCLLLVTWWRRETSFWSARLLLAERRAKALRHHFGLANRNANDIVFLIDEQKNILEANPVAVESYGYTRKELGGMAVADLRADDPVERARVAGQFEAALSGSTRFEALHRRKDGSTFPVEVSSRRFDTDGRTYVQSIVRDISDRRRADEALRESEERFRATFEQAAVGIAHIAPDGRWLRVNERLCRILGYTHDELLGKTFQEITHPGDLDHVLENMRTMLEGRLTDYWLEKRYLRKDGEIVWARLSVSLARRPGGDPDYFISVVEDVSDQKAQRGEILRLSQERADLVARLQRQFAGMPFGCAVMDEGMRVLDVNPAFERIFGWSQAEFLAAQDALALIVPTDERFELDTQLVVAAAAGSSLDRVNENVTRDGRRIICRWTNVPLPNPAGGYGGMFSMCEDITARLEAERELREREARFRALAELAPAGVFRLAPDGRVLYANPAMSRIVGQSADEAADLGWVAALHPEDRERALHHWQQLQRGVRIPPEEVRYLHPDGHVVWGQVQVAPVPDDQGRVIEFIGTVTDITPFKDVERTLSERIESRTGELRLAKERAEQADRIKTGFLSTMSHELRTPLNSIIGFTSVLLEKLAGPLNDRQVRQLEVIQESSRHLLALINDILDISRIEAAQLTINVGNVELQEVLERVARRFEVQAELKDLALVVDLEADLGRWRTDERRLEQVLTNLVANAVKFTERGRVTLRARTAGTWLEVAVTDTGLGIRSEDIDSLFVPFTQLTPADGKLREGTGLGLAISWRLARALGGELSVTSDFEVGSTFTLRLPKEPAQAPRTRLA